MKRNLFLLMLPIFFAFHLFAQVKEVKPLTQKTVETSPTTNKITKPKPIKTENVSSLPPTDLQKAVVNVTSGDDGKDDNTLVQITINDGNQRSAAYCSDIEKEYFPGENQTLSGRLVASEPTGQIKQVGATPIPVTREATLSDFSQGGSIDVLIETIGNDTWKIGSLSLTLYFNNDPGSPHKISWTGFTLTQDNKTKHLEFDKNFNPIQ